MPERSVQPGDWQPLFLELRHRSQCWSRVSFTAGGLTLHQLGRRIAAMSAGTMVKD